MYLFFWNAHVFYVAKHKFKGYVLYIIQLLLLWGHYNKLATQEVQYTERDMWVEGLIGKTWILRLKMKNKLHMYRSVGLFCALWTELIKCIKHGMVHLIFKR